jgi:protein-S-isoprenylcysteine O-methyltransferase Ste14
VTHSLYRFLRHPIYLSFLGLIWFTPRMSLDHVLLTGVWTAYIFIGSYLKDERLAFYVGSPYREYQTRVPGYPLFFGALGRHRIRPSSTELEQMPIAVMSRHAA